MSEPAVELRGVDAGYDGARILHGLDLLVERGAFVGVVGPSGSGKTTLLRLLTGRADPVAGEVRVLGRPVRRRRPPGRVGYVPQVGEVDWDFPLTVEQAVLGGLAADSAPVPWYGREERRRVASMLERLGLGELGGRHIRELSGGQQQRMFLARAMVRRCDLVLLDEPTSGVDLRTRHDVLHLLDELNEQGMTILLTTHDLNWVAAHLPRVVCLNGTVIADGPPTRVFTPQVLGRTYDADVRVITEGDLVFVADQTHLLTRRHHHAEAAGETLP